MKKDKTDVLTKWSPPRVPTLWEPFREFEKMWDRFFSFFGGRWLEPYFEPEEFFSAWTPSVDIEESDHEYLLRAELPGMKKEEVKVKVQGRTLRFRASESRKRKKKTRDIFALNELTARSGVALRSPGLSYPRNSQPSLKTEFSTYIYPRTKALNRTLLK
jgi:hypothetical protein